MSVDIKQAMEEFTLLKRDSADRNQQYYLLRQAVKGNFRWPRNWPTHIPKRKRNLCKAIVERHSTYLMGRSFTWNVDRPNSLEMREAAERAEKVLKRLLKLSKADIKFIEGAKSGSKLGRTIYKVYKKGGEGNEHACFSLCPPDYFYGVPCGAEDPGEFSVVYYSYPVDKAEAVRRWGPGAYKTEAEQGQAERYETLREQNVYTSAQKRRVPVVEIWTPESHALIVGGVVKYNGDNPNVWLGTGEKFIPFTVIENIRNDEEGYGEADIGQVRDLNEEFNWLFSRRSHVVMRYLTPTIVWEGAPQNYTEILTSAMDGGGAIPTRLGSRLSFLSYDRESAMVGQQMQDVLDAIMDTSGMNPAALQGIVQGSINTGPALSVQFQPMLSTVDKKRNEWTVGIQDLFAKMLNVQEQIGDSASLGEAVINARTKTKDATPNAVDDEGYNEDGQVVVLSGADIQGLRDVSISWPGVLPKDDFQWSALEIQKAQSGLQSYYTTLEKLGEDFPDDELARIRMENEDPSLKGEKVAEQLRAQTPLVKAAMQQDTQMAQMQQQAPPGPQMPPGMPPMDPAAQGGPPPPDDQQLAAGGDVSARMREMSRAAQSKLDTGGDFPAFTSGEGY